MNIKIEGEFIFCPECYTPLNGDICKCGHNTKHDEDFLKGFIINGKTYIEI